MRAGIQLDVPIVNTYVAVEFEPTFRLNISNNIVEGCYGKYVAGGNAVDSTTFSVVLSDAQLLQILGVIKAAGQATGAIPLGTAITR